MQKADRLQPAYKAVKLGDLISLEYGTGLPESKREPGTYPVYGSNGVIGYHKTSIVKGPGIIIGRKGSIGEVTWSNSDFWPIDTTYYVALKKEDVLLKWLYYLLPQLKLKDLNAATGIPGLNRNDAYAVKCLLPSVKEQTKIASMLMELDELIQKIDQIIEQTQRLKKGLMQKLLTKGIGHKRYKSVGFGPSFLKYDIPDKWQVLTLNQCIRSDTSITYGIVQAGPHVPDGVPYIRTGDMSGGRLSKDSMLCTSNEIASSFRRSQIKRGEIVCALRGIVGTVLEVPEELDGANLTQGTARISPRHDIDKRYLLWSLRSEYAKRQFEIFSKGTTLNEITLERLRIIKVAIPSDLDEQKNIGHILDHLELAVGLQQRFKEKVLILKSGLIQKLLTGQIRVRV